MAHGVGNVLFYVYGVNFEAVVMMTKKKGEDEGSHTHGCVVRES